MNLPVSVCFPAPVPFGRALQEEPAGHRVAAAASLDVKGKLRELEDALVAVPITKSDSLCDFSNEHASIQLLRCSDALGFINMGFGEAFAAPWAFPGLLCGQWADSPPKAVATSRIEIETWVVGIPFAFV